MDTHEMNRILHESYAELSRILDDCRNGPAENVRIVDIMEPMLQEILELQEQVFYDVEQSDDQSSNY